MHLKRGGRQRRGKENKRDHGITEQADNFNFQKNSGTNTSTVYIYLEVIKVSTSRYEFVKSKYTVFHSVTECQAL